MELRSAWAETGLQNRRKETRVSKIGPELPTLAEKFVRSLRLPYILGCIIWALVFVEIPMLLDQFLLTHDTISTQVIIYRAIVFLMSFYVPLSIRFMRTKIQEGELEITQLLPKGEADYHDSFANAFSYRGQILVIIAFALLAIPLVIQFQSLISRVVVSISAIYIVFMWGSLVWLNFGCVIGLYRLGKKSLNFKSFREDAKLGTKPIGSISLSLAVAYFVGLAMLILFSALNQHEAFKSPYFIVLYSILIVVGLVMFFLPLYRIHVRMVEEKTNQDLLIQSYFDCMSHDLKSREGEDPLINIQKLLSLDLADRKLQVVSTWPFDTALLGRLSVIILSVIAALIARSVAAPLHL